MVGGVVDYKLCDRQYECEQCPFDAAIREGAHLHRGLEQKAGSPGRINIQGYELMPMLFYHPNHLWARIEDAGSVRIGMDDFGQSLMGRLYAIELPEPGGRVSASAACWRVAHHAGETSLAAPVSGHVLEANPRLVQHPSLINRDPYGEGWVMVIQPDRLEQCLQQLYYGSRVEQWYEVDIQNLYRAMGEMLLTSLPSVGSTMQDGGSRNQDFTSLLTAEQMRQMINSFLSAPVRDRSAAPGADVMGPNRGR
jgi:glycine cleavage system H lipoate-binding protein